MHLSIGTPAFVTRALLASPLMQIKMEAEFRSLVERMAVELLTKDSSGLHRNEEATAFSIQRSPRNSEAGSTSCVSADDILGWLCMRHRASVSYLGASRLKSEYVTPAEAVKLAQRAVDYGYIERVALVHRGKAKKYRSLLRQSLLNDEDRVAARRRRVFRAGGTRFWRFVLSRIVPEEDVVRVSIGRIRLPVGAAGLLPSVGYVSACLRIDLVLKDHTCDQEDGEGVGLRRAQRFPDQHQFPPQRYRSTMVRRVPDAFELDETVQFAIPRWARDSAFFVVELLNEAAHGVLHNRSLGATCVSLNVLLESGCDDSPQWLTLRLAHRDSNASERLMCAPACDHGNQRPSQIVWDEAVDCNTTSAAVEMRAQSISSRRKTMARAPMSASQTKRICCVCYEVRNVVYDMAETHGLKWSLSTRLVAGRKAISTPWQPKIFNNAQLLSNMQRIAGGGARFSNMKKADHPSWMMRGLSSVFARSESTMSGGELASHISESPSPAVLSMFGLLRSVDSQDGKKIRAQDNVPCSNDEAFVKGRDEHNEDYEADSNDSCSLGEEEEDEDEITRRALHTTSGHCGSHGGRDVLHRGVSLDYERDAGRQGYEREHCSSKDQTEDDDFRLPKHAEGCEYDDEEGVYYPKLVVEATVNVATEPVRLVVLQKSSGGIPRRVGAAIMPVPDLPMRREDPQWLTLVNTGPCGVLTRNGEVKASVWVEDVEDQDTSVTDYKTRLSWLWCRVRGVNVAILLITALVTFAVIWIVRRDVAVTSLCADRVEPNFRLSTRCLWQTFMRYLMRFASLIAVATVIIATRLFGPLLWGRLAGTLISRFGVIDACDVSIDSLLMSIFLTRGSGANHGKIKCAYNEGSLGKWRLVFHVEVRGFRFGNPSASLYPHRHLASAAYVHVVLSITLRDVLTTLRSLCKGGWRASPRACVAMFGMSDDDRCKTNHEFETRGAPFDRSTRRTSSSHSLRNSRETQPRLPWPYAGVLTIEALEIRCPEVNIELDAAGELNVVALTRDIANAKVASAVRRHQYMPNTLRVQFIAARGIPVASTKLASGVLKNGQVLVARCRVRSAKWRDTDPSEPLEIYKGAGETSSSGGTSREADGQFAAASWRNGGTSISFDDIRCDDASAVLTIDLYAVEAPTRASQASVKWRTSSARPSSPLLPQTNTLAKTSGAHLIGRWLTTLEALVRNPGNRLVRTNKFRSSADSSLSSPSFQCSGWFPLRNGSLEYADPADPHGCGFGEFSLVITWQHRKITHPLFSSSMTKLPQKSALDQLIDNSRECGLRLGAAKYTKRMLQTFPLLLNVQTIALFEVNVRLHDIFMGCAGQAVTGAGEHSRIHIPKIILDDTTFKRKKLQAKGRTPEGLGSSDWEHTDDNRDYPNLYEFLEALALRGVAPNLLGLDTLLQLFSHRE